MLTRKQHIKISVIISFVTMIISLLIHIFYTPFLLDKVGDTNYGLLSFVTSTLSWLTIVVNAILAAYNKIVSEQIAESPELGESRTNTIYSFIIFLWAFFIAIISSVIIILLHTGVITINKYSSEEINIIKILLIIVTLQMSLTLLTRVSSLNITYNHKHVWVKSITLLSTIACPVIAVPFLIKGHGIITIAIIQMAVHVAAGIADILFDRFVLKKKYAFFPDKQTLKMLWPIFTFCSIIILNEIAYQIDLSIDTIVLGFKGYPNKITLYQLAVTIVTLASTCSTMIYTPFIPLVFSNEAQGKSEENKKIFDYISFGQMLLWIFIMGGFISCGKEFVELWVGNQKIEIYYICIILFGIRMASTSSACSKDMMRAKNHHLIRAILALCVTIVNICTTILFVNLMDEQFAIYGCLIGTAISSILGWWITANVLNYIYLKIDIKTYFINMLILVLLMGASSLLSIKIKHVLRSSFALSPILLLLISGFLFVLVFGGVVFAVFRKKILMLIRLIKGK